MNNNNYKIWKQKKIYLRKPLSTISLKYHLKRFFQITTFSSEYIAIQTKFGQNKLEVPTKTLGEYYYINLNNEGELINYIDHIISQLYEIIKNKEVKSIYVLCFNYIPTNKLKYDKFLNLLSQI